MSVVAGCVEAVVVRWLFRLELRGYRLGTKQFSLRARACTMVNVKRQTFHPRPEAIARFTLALIVFAACAVPWAAEPALFPGEFRVWVHVKSVVIMPGANSQMKSEEGMHHIFANQKAADAFASGDFPDGSMIVYELRDAQQNNGVITEGDRRRVDVMIKDSTRYSATGGWRFERFWANDQGQDAIKDSGAGCFACHEKAKGHGFIFSQLH